MSHKICNFALFNRQRTQTYSFADVDFSYPYGCYIQKLFGCLQLLMATFAMNVVFFGEKKERQTAFYISTLISFIKCQRTMESESR